MGVRVCVCVCERERERLTGMQRDSSSISAASESTCGLIVWCCCSVPFSGRQGARHPPIVSVDFATDGTADEKLLVAVTRSASPIGPAMSSLEKSSKSSIWNTSTKLLPPTTAAASGRGFCCCFRREPSNAAAAGSRKAAAESIWEANYYYHLTAPAPRLDFCSQETRLLLLLLLNNNNAWRGLDNAYAFVSRFPNGGRLVQPRGRRRRWGIAAQKHPNLRGAQKWLKMAHC